MSGFIAIFNSDGSPVDHALLRRLSASLAFRGPDAQRIWCDGPIGLGHALLRTTRESAVERQPMSLDGGVWIVADARIDAREELIQTLDAAVVRSAEPISADAPDVELILRAYIAWGVQCVDRLLGDFSFVIWDERERRLFAARDHFGIKPLFYAEVDGALVLSNTLNCLRLHPEVSGQLDDRFIGDFLLIGMPYDPAATAFANIARLPAAHTLTSNGTAGTGHNGLQLRRYWTLPIEEPLRYKREADYVEQFDELLRDAVRGRLRTDRVTVSLSGGLDSSGVAAVACCLLSGGASAAVASGAVRGITMVYDRMIPDRERHFSGVVAGHLGIPIDYIACDEHSLFEGCDDSSTCGCEPLDYTAAAANRRRFKLAAAHSRVLLTGEGGDAGLIPSLTYYRRWRLPDLLWQVSRYVASHGTLPRAGFRLTFDRWRGRRPRSSAYPAWLQPAFEIRAGVRERWRELNRQPARLHPHRPDSYDCLTAPSWSFTFDVCERMAADEGVEARHPFFDVRLMRFFLRLPTLPWCAEKELLRRGLHPLLPAEITRRPKAPLAGEPVQVMLRQPESRWIDDFQPSPALSEYVVRGRIPPLTTAIRAADWYVNLLPLSLDYWLRHKNKLEYKSAAALEGEFLDERTSERGDEKKDLRKA